MSSIEVRAFHRRDRDQLTGLVNAHAAAVVPGIGVSVSTLLGHLERQPGEAIVDPWVSERATLVACTVTGWWPPPICCATTPTSAPGRRTGAPGRSPGCCFGPRLRPGTGTGRTRRRPRKH